MSDFKKALRRFDGCDPDHIDDWLRAIRSLLLTPAPDDEAIRVKLELFREYELHSVLGAGDYLDAIAGDVERLIG